MLLPYHHVFSPVLCKMPFLSFFLYFFLCQPILYDPSSAVSILFCNATRYPKYRRTYIHNVLVKETQYPFSISIYNSNYHEPSTHMNSFYCVLYTIPQLNHHHHQKQHHFLYIVIFSLEQKKSLKKYNAMQYRGDGVM